MLVQGALILLVSDAPGPSRFGFYSVLTKAIPAIKLGWLSPGHDFASA
jgi:hypothetical protein